MPFSFEEPAVSIAETKSHLSEVIRNLSSFLVYKGIAIIK